MCDAWTRAQKSTTMKKATTFFAFLFFAAGLMAQNTPQDTISTTILNTGEIAVFNGCDGCDVIIVFSFV